MFSLKTILFAATAALAGVASAAPLADSPASALVARDCGCNSIPEIFTGAGVKLDAILVDVRKYPVLHLGHSPTD